MAPSILSSVIACHNAFDELIDDIQNADEGDPQDWAGERGRLCMWTAYNCAKETGPSSLDFRLRDSSHVRQPIIKFLNDLLLRLKEVQKARAGGEESDTESTEDEDEDEDADGDEDEAPGTYMDALRSSVGVLINCLNGMSILADNPARIDHRIGVKQSDVSGQ
ncbi:MAG: hypothetical protein Q9208_002874 [Pyrenodesmia sp. 3 TL-2023]